MVMELLDQVANVFLALPTEVESGGLVGNSAAMANVSGYEHLHEMFYLRFLDTLVKNTDAPTLKRFGVRKKEFLATEIPTARKSWLSNRPTVLHLWWRKNACLCLNNVRYRVHT
jgi:hypothetical protein